MNGGRVIEVKRVLDRASAAERRYDCELVELTASRAVVLFRLVRDGGALDSYGVFWRRRPYNCYYAVHAVAAEDAREQQRARPVFVRFDVVSDVEIDLLAAPPEVRYTDLLLDLWVDDGGVRWEDDDEVQERARAGTLRSVDARRIESARGFLERGHRRIALEVRTLLRGLGVPV